MPGPFELREGARDLEHRFNPRLAEARDAGLAGKCNLRHPTREVSIPGSLRRGMPAPRIAAVGRRACRGFNPRLAEARDAGPYVVALLEAC